MMDEIVLHCGASDDDLNIHMLERYSITDNFPFM